MLPTSDQMTVVDVADVIGFGRREAIPAEVRLSAEMMLLAKVVLCIVVTWFGGKG